MRLLTAALLTTLLLTSCSKASQEEVKKPQKTQQADIKKEEAIIEALLKPLKVRGVEVKEVKPAESVKVPGFRVFEVTLLDKINSREIKRYIFISPDNRYLTLEIFEVKEEGKTIHLKPIRPKNPVKQVKVDLSWVKEIDKKLQEANIPHVVGKSDRKVYIVWDVFCPFCYGHFNQIKEIAEKNNVEVHMIPFPIHGENSLKGLIYYTQLAREKGTAEAFRELYNLGNGNFRAYAKKLEEKEKELKLSKEEQEKLKKFFNQLKEELVKKGVHATPSIIYIPEGEKDKGYIIVGFKPIDQVLKMK
jgi:thiol:disulfide interchange protein DsbC